MAINFPHPDKIVIYFNIWIITLIWFYTFFSPVMMLCPRNSLNMWRLWCQHESHFSHTTCKCLNAVFGPDTETHQRHMDDQSVITDQEVLCPRYICAFFFFFFVPQPGYMCGLIQGPDWTGLASICYRFPWQQEEEEEENVESCQWGAS